LRCAHQRGERDCVCPHDNRGIFSAVQAKLLLWLADVDFFRCFFVGEKWGGGPNQQKRSKKKKGCKDTKKNIPPKQTKGGGEPRFKRAPTTQKGWTQRLGKKQRLSTKTKNKVGGKTSRGGKPPPWGGDQKKKKWGPSPTPLTRTSQGLCKRMRKAQGGGGVNYPPKNKNKRQKKKKNPQKKNTMAKNSPKTGVFCPPQKEEKKSGS